MVLFGTRVSAGIIKARIKMRAHCSLRWVLYPMRVSLERQKRIHRDTRGMAV